MSRPMRPGLAARLAGALTGLVSAVAGGAEAAQAQPKPVAPEQAPAAWVTYAESASRAVAEWLQEDGADAQAARAALTEEVVLKLWVAADGRVERVEVPPLAHAEGDAALRRAILGRALAAPPKGMLLPMRIAVGPGQE